MLHAGIALAVAAGVALGFVVGCVLLFAVMTNNKRRYLTIHLFIFLIIYFI